MQKVEINREKIRQEAPLKFLTLWAINGKLNRENLICQLRNMKQSGFDGTIFHPRYYPNIPPYLSEEYCRILSDAILAAKELEMEFWIYDENGWPSGRADGKVMERLGDCLCEYLVYEEGKVQKREIHQVNTFSSEAMEAFVDITYEGYRKGLTAEAFEYVTGFFSDEVGFLDGYGVSIQTGGVPWHKEISRRYRQNYGTVLEEELESLFIEKPGYETVRFRFWETAADLLAENYYGRINQWCLKYGKQYTAHLKGEENLFFQISPSGSAFRNLLGVNTPAVDALERYPGNHYYPRIPSSISKQFGDGICLVEAMGGSGWGMAPKDLESYVDWLAGSGISTFAFHICQYEQNAASVCDWPPDIPFGLSWKEVFPTLFEKLHQKWDGKVVKKCPVLLVAPVRRVMAEFVPSDAMQINEHNGANVPMSKSGSVSTRFLELSESLYRRGMEFDVAEEWMVEEYGKVQDGTFLLGSQCYQCVIFGEDCLWGETSVAEQLKSEGIGHEGAAFGWSFVKSGCNQIVTEKEGTAVIETGDFLVESMSSWEIYDKRQLMTKGPFQICRNQKEAKEKIDCGDLIRSGFPFMKEPVTVESLFYIDQSGICRIEEESYIHADAAYVTVDGDKKGFCWGPDWEVCGIAEGIHQVTVTLIPSTYNTYGPHHYYLGDHFLISPDQYKGKKNFADTASAPDSTKVEDWHFVKFGIGRQ